MDRIIERTINNLNKHHFDARYFDNAESLKNAVLEELKKYNSFAFGGSMTIEELKLKEFIIENGKTYIERISENEEKKLQSEREALHSDIYFAGINAISVDGQIVNIDKRGNRVGAITFGPKRVILISGTNKITQSLEQAIKRAKNIAAVNNCKRFSLNTPCVKAEHCVDCEHIDNICYSTLILKRSYPHKRIAIYLLNGKYGF